MTFVSPISDPRRLAAVMAGLCFVLTWGRLAVAQEGPIDTARYWIFLADKPGSLATEVDARTLNRRWRRGGAVDPAVLAPVSASYLDRLRRVGIEPLVRSRWLNAVSARLRPDQIDAVRALPFVRALRPVHRVRTAASDASVALAPETPMRLAPPGLTPHRTVDTHFGLATTQLGVINADVALQAGFDGTGVRIGFLDTAFDITHVAFDRLRAEGRFVADTSFAAQPETNLHGLGVSSVAVGFHPDTLVGPCHGAEVLFATTEETIHEVNREEDNLVAGLEWMERMGADIVNISLGYDVFDDGERSYTYEDLDGDTPVTSQAVDMAVRLGMTVVTAAGNSAGCSGPGEGCWYYIGTPADADSVITAGGVQADSTRYNRSSFGPTADGRIKPDVAAQAVGVWYATRNDGYATGNGTSFASPLVAGVACQILQANPNLTPIQVRDLLRSTASQADRPDNSLGWGIVDAYAAVSAALEVVGREEEVPQIFETWTLLPAAPNPSSSRVALGFEAPVVNETVRLRIYDLLGRLVAEPFAGLPEAGKTRLKLDVSNLTPGLYLVRLDTPDGPLTGRFIVTR